MEKVTCNVLYRAKIMSHFSNEVVYERDKITGEMNKKNDFHTYSDLGLFTSKIDAFAAIEAYRKIVNEAQLTNFAVEEGQSIEKEIIPETKMKDIWYYNNVQEFVSDNLMIENCRKKIGKDAINKILVDLGLKITPDQEKIIGRMVSDYVLKKRKEELTDNQYNKQITNCQENIDFLNGLKNGK